MAARRLTSRRDTTAPGPVPRIRFWARGLGASAGVVHRAGAVDYDATKNGIAPVSMPTPSITSETIAARHSTLRW